MVAIRANDLACASRQLPGIRLVVAGIDDCGSVSLQAIAKSQRRVIEVLSPYVNVSDVELALNKLVVTDRCPS